MNSKNRGNIKSIPSLFLAGGKIGKLWDGFSLFRHLFIELLQLSLEKRKKYFFQNVSY